MALLMGSFCGRCWFSCVLRGALHFLIYTTLLIKKKVQEESEGRAKQREWKNGLGLFRGSGLSIRALLAQLASLKLVIDKLAAGLYNNPQPRVHFR
jgi:hypothetical protein